MQYLPLVNLLKSQINLNCSVVLLYYNENISPFTFGIKKPVIVLTSLVTEDSATYILQHELQHIKSHDLVYRIICMLLIVLHCFNPFSYLLLKELKEIQEMKCDEKVIKSLSKQERCKYGSMIISISSGVKSIISPAIFFSKTSKSFLTKRIQAISSPVSTKLSSICICFFLLCMFSSIPVLAYSPTTYDWRNTGLPFQGDDNMTWCEITITEKNTASDQMSIDEQYFHTYNSYFILENGDIIPCTIKNISSYASCIHTFRSGTYKTHLKNGKSCTVKTYSAQICTKCQYVKNTSLISSTYYPNCPH